MCELKLPAYQCSENHGTKHLGPHWHLQIQMMNLPKEGQAATLICAHVANYAH